ncbi:MAG: hypothetical protein PHN57_05355 [Candidatus Omnitrophica bacterium]|nr:hypothetical protein [Candidatus Omnitrophota bacterium]
MNKKAQTLMEVLTASILLLLVSYGLAGLFLASHRHIIRSHFRLAAAEMGKVYLDPLQMDVRQDIVANPAAASCLKSGVGCPLAQTLDNVAYTNTYVRSLLPLSDGQNVTKVILTVVWAER